MSATTLPTANRFEALYIDSQHTKNSDGLDSVSSDASIENPPLQTPQIFPWCKKMSGWLCCQLPYEYQLAITPGGQKLEILIELQSPDMMETVSSLAVIDGGVSGLFLDQDFIMKYHLPMIRLLKLIPVYNVDDTPNQAGSITHVVDLVIHFCTHTERALFTVTALGKYPILLGLPWLKVHNPEINWQTHKVKLIHCSNQCQSCVQQLMSGKHSTHILCDIWSLPIVILDDTDSSEDETPELADNEDEINFEEGDCLFAVSMNWSKIQSECIYATETISQCLAQAYALNTNNDVPKGFWEIVPPLFHYFEDIFAKESFDSLPGSKK